ncbi:MAG: response regulator [Oscillospiraceae bacterium]|nr:response regulator [Oscillospiraceae bacterium]
MMKKSEMENLHKSLNVETSIIEEFVNHQEDLLISFSSSAEVREFLKDPDNDEKRLAAQKYTEKYYTQLNNWEGLYIGEWNTHVIAHSDTSYIGMITRKGDPLKQLQNAMTENNGIYNAGIIVSPATKRLILSLYCPVFDYDGTTIIGYVGGGPFAEELDKLLADAEDDEASYYMINAESQMYIFAQDESLMATEIKDEMLLSVLSRFSQDSSSFKGNIEYTDKKAGKSIAVYQYIPKYNWAVVSCNSEMNIYEDVGKNMRVLAVICVVSDFIIVLISWVVIKFSTKPLNDIEASITQLKVMNLEKTHSLDKYINTESEIGQIATAVDSLYDSIKDMLDAEKEKQTAIAKSESKAKFLANVSHELRTPINTIIGMNEMIIRESEDETAVKYAVNTKSAGKMLLDIINDVLDFSKIDAGKLKIVEEDYNIMSVLNDATFGIKVRAEQKNLKFICDFDTKLPSVLKGDEIRIRQILNNLLSNAVKYTSEGSVTLKAEGINRQDGFSLLLSVTDTGSGIREEDMKNLFGSFERLDLKKNRSIEGTGLGLSITKQLTELMNGEIKVESEYNHGSCFSVCIPQQVVDATPVEEFDESANLSKIKDDLSKDYLYAPEAKILIVDDNELNLEIMEVLLKRSGMQLTLVSGGNECLEITEKEEYDLILMDHMMPEPDGVETLHLIRSNSKNKNYETPVVALTAHTGTDIEQQYVNEGFSGYLSKPIDVKKLESVIAEHLVKIGKCGFKNNNSI